MMNVSWLQQWPQNSVIMLALLVIVLVVWGVYMVLRETSDTIRTVCAILGIPEDKPSLVTVRWGMMPVFIPFVSTMMVRVPVSVVPSITDRETANDVGGRLLDVLEMDDLEPPVLQHRRWIWRFSR